MRFVPHCTLVLAAVVTSGASAQFVTETVDGTVSPADLGFEYLVVGNTAPAEQVFTLKRGIIYQQTMGLGYAGQGSNAWTKNFYIPNLSPWVLRFRVRVTQSEQWSFPFGSYVAFGNSGLALMANQIYPYGSFGSNWLFDSTQWHDYRLESTACGQWAFYIDNALFTSGVGSWTNGNLLLAFGDGTGGANANAEYDYVELTVNTGITSDLNGDGTVDASDLAILLGAWGQPGVTDLNCSGTTEAGDLAVLLGEWG